MSLLGSGSVSLRNRALVAIGGVLLLLGPLVVALEHPAHEGTAAALVHAEASHPDAAPHLDQKGHPTVEGCPICLHEARALGEELTDTSVLAVRKSLAAVAAPVRIVGGDARTDQARAPPA